MVHQTSQATSLRGFSSQGLAATPPPETVPEPLTDTTEAPAEEQQSRQPLAR